MTPLRHLIPAGLRPFAISTALLCCAFSMDANGPGAALDRLRDQLKLGKQPEASTVMADIAGADGRTAAKGIVAAMARKLNTENYDFTVLDDHVIEDCGLVILRERQPDNTKRIVSYLYLKQGTWKAMPLGVNDARVTGLSTEQRQRINELSRWFAQRKRELDTPAIAVPPTASVKAAPTPVPSPESASVVTAPTATNPGNSTATAATNHPEDEDVEDPFIKANISLELWTEIQRRSSFNGYLPSAMTIPEGHFHYHIVHVAREAYREDLATNLLGMDDDVSIGIELGYGILENFDVSLQRQNGHNLDVITDSSDTTSFDYYDLLFRWHALDQLKGILPGIADVAIIVGGTLYLRNQTSSDVSLNYGIMVERNFLWDRLRLGTGIVHAGLSSYESSYPYGPANKPFPDEYHALPPGQKPPDESTTSIPLNIKIALDQRWQLYGEVIVPIAGYRTGEGPSATAGLRLNGNTHEYSFFVTNTANVSFTSAITGGATHISNLPLFGFNISAHL